MMMPILYVFQSKRKIPSYFAIPDAGILQPGHFTLLDGRANQILRSASAAQH